MKPLDLNRALVDDRLRFIERSIESLRRFRHLSLDEFNADPDFFRIAYYDLYTALEACLDIGAHILSRKPGVAPKTYRDIPLLLAGQKILPRRFAEERFAAMAGYRNRLSHFYHRLSPAEILEILKTGLDDFEVFGRHIRKILLPPDRTPEAKPLRNSAKKRSRI